MSDDFVRLASIGDWLSWLVSLDFHPLVFLTLTFDEKRLGDVSVPKSYWWWQQLVKRLNTDLYGVRYRNKVKHCYFSYLVTHEFTARGCVHLHALADGYVDFKAVHSYWNLYCGWAWISKIPNPSARHPVAILKTSDEQSAMKYVLKYVMKGSAFPRLWIKEKRITVSVVRFSDDGPVGPVFTDYDDCNPPDV